MSKQVIAVICVAVLLLTLPLLAKLAKNTEPAADAAPVEKDMEASAPAATPGAPAVLTFDPPNGATGVSPSKSELRITFNMPMGAGFSWTGSGDQFPQSQPGQKPYWMPDKKTCVLPVSLQPNKAYRLGLNSPSHKNFMTESGIPLAPVEYRFTTGPAGS